MQTARRHCESPPLPTSTHVFPAVGKSLHFLLVELAVWGRGYKHGRLTGLGLGMWNGAAAVTTHALYAWCRRTRCNASEQRGHGGEPENVGIGDQRSAM
ncbi:hypothetical protein B0H10DRAFT_2059022, partial [Mycena sp. CBHHK59/15]